MLIEDGRQCPQLSELRHGGIGARATSGHMLGDRCGERCGRIRPKDTDRVRNGAVEFRDLWQIRGDNRFGGRDPGGERPGRRGRSEWADCHMRCRQPPLEFAFGQIAGYANSPEKLLRVDLVGQLSDEFGTADRRATGKDDSVSAGKWGIASSSRRWPLRATIIPSRVITRRFSKPSLRRASTGVGRFGRTSTKCGMTVAATGSPKLSQPLPLRFGTDKNLSSPMDDQAERAGRRTMAPTEGPVSCRVGADSRRLPDGPRGPRPPNARTLR